MPQLQIVVEGTGGAFQELLKTSNVIWVEEPILMETLDGGMQSGAPSIGIMLVVSPAQMASKVPNKPTVVIGQTSLRLFQAACAATLSKYGNVTGNAQMGLLAGGTAHLTFSNAVACPACKRDIPGSCRYCPECGVKL